MSFANQLIKKSNKAKHALAPDKQNLRFTCLKGKLKFELSFDIFMNYLDQDQRAKITAILTHQRN